MSSAIGLGFGNSIQSQVGISFLVINKEQYTGHPHLPDTTDTNQRYPSAWCRGFFMYPIEQRSTLNEVCIAREGDVQ
jgi:hypothetical protein